MVRHTLLLQPNPQTRPEQIEDIRRQLAGLVGQIPGLLDFCWGANFADPARQDGYSYGFSMDFEDRATLSAYAPHPAHQPIAALVRAAFGRIAVLDIDL